MRVAPASHNPNHRALLPAEKLSLSPIYAKIKRADESDRVDDGGDSP